MCLFEKLKLNPASGNIFLKEYHMKNDHILQHSYSETAHSRRQKMKVEA